MVGGMAKFLKKILAAAFLPRLAGNENASSVRWGFRAAHAETLKIRSVGHRELSVKHRAATGLQ